MRAALAMTDPSVDPPTNPAPPARIAGLSGRSRTLADALLRKAGRTEYAVGMYLEALTAIERSDSVESLHVAAYELREFMGALPLVLDVPQATYEHMKAKVNELADHCERSCSRSKNFSNGSWSGDIDGHARGLLDGLGEFVEWWRTNVPTRRDEVKAVLRALVPVDRPMPEALWDGRSKEWSELLKYFNAITHHERRAGRDEFLEQLKRLEDFLLEHLEPRTFEDLDELDALITDAEAQS